MFRSCKNWLDEFRTYARDENGNIMSEAKYHLMAATRYLLLDSLSHSAAKPVTQPSLRRSEARGIRWG